MSVRIGVRALILLSAAVLAVSVLCFAAEPQSAEDSGTCGRNLSWQYDDTAKSLTISLIDPEVTGAMDDYAEKKQPWYGHAGDITSISLPSGMTRLGDHAFMDCGQVADVKFGDGLLAIGSYQFLNCGLSEGAESMVLPATLNYLDGHALAGCRLPVDIGRIPAALAFIGDYAFYGCNGCTGPLVIPDSVTYLGVHQFSGTGISSVVLGKGLDTLNDYAFHGMDRLESVTLTEGLKKIGRYAMSNPNIRCDIVLPKSLKEISEYAFKGSKGITGLVIEEGVDYIGTYAFEGCSGITGSLRLPITLQEIPSFCFSGCTGLQSVVFTGTLAIGLSAFDGCTSLESVTMNDQVREIGPYAFKQCQSLTSLRMGTHMRTLGAYAFSECSSLAGLDLPLALVTIGPHCFSGCSSIKGSLRIPPGVTDIGSYAFSGCTSLDGELNLPQSLSTVEQYAFSGCTSLGSVTLLPGITGIQNSVFQQLRFLDGNGKPVDPRGDGFVGYTYKRDADGNMVRDSPVAVLDVTYTAPGTSGDVPVQQPLQAGQTFCAQPCDIVKQGYVFIGWKYGDEYYSPFDTITMGDGQMVLTAAWLRTHTVSYNPQGGEGPIPESQTVIEDLPFTVQDYQGTKEGQMFIGWQYNGAQYLPGDSFFMGRTDIVFTAMWTSMHSVTYDINGGSGDAPTQEDVWMGQSFVVQSYSGTKDGYVFGGWAYKGDLYVPGSVFVMWDDDVILTAHWIKTRSVTYDLKGGEGEVPKQDPVPEKGSFRVQACTAVREGYLFGGWQCNIDGQVYHEGDTIGVSYTDIVLSAVWNIIRAHYIMFDVNGGSAIAPAPVNVDSGEKYTIEFSPGVKNRCVFGGWSDGTATYNIGDTVTMGSDDLVLVAMWSVRDPFSNITPVFLMGGLIMGILAAAVFIPWWFKTHRTRIDRDGR